MERDIEYIVGLLARARYVRIMAVMSGAAFEGSIVFSTKEDAARKQVNWRWSEAAGCLHDRSIACEPCDVDNLLLLPYLRRLYLARNHRSLSRVVEVLDRIRVPLLEALASGEVKATCATREGLSLGEALLQALVDYDMPAIADLANRYGRVREGLSDHLRITRLELADMSNVTCDAWDALGVGDRWFGRFDPSRRSG